MTDAPPDPDAAQLRKLAAFLRLIPEGGPLDQLLKGAALLEEPQTTPSELASDILHGAAAIARFLYGNEGYRRRVYRLIGADNLPYFRIGRAICSRRSVLLSWANGRSSRF